MYGSLFLISSECIVMIDTLFSFAICAMYDNDCVNQVLISSP